MNHAPSRLLNGEIESRRGPAFSRRMTRDLMQASADFCKNIGLIPICGENHTSRKNSVAAECPRGRAVSAFETQRHRKELNHAIRH